MSGMRGRERHGASKGKRSPTPQQDPSLLIRPQTAPILSLEQSEGELEESGSSNSLSRRAKTPQPGARCEENSGDNSVDDNEEELKRAAAEAHFKEALSQLFESKPSNRINGFNSLARILRTTYLGQETLELNIETLGEFISKAIEHGSTNERIAASMMCEAYCASIGDNRPFFECVSTSFYNVCSRTLGNNTSETLPSAVVRAYATLCYCCSSLEEDTKRCMEIIERVFMPIEGYDNDNVSDYMLSAAISSWALLCTTASLDTDESQVVAERFVEILTESDSVDVRMETFLALGVLFENVRDSISVLDDDDGGDDDEYGIVDCRGKVGKKEHKRMPTLYDCPSWIDPSVIEEFKKDSTVKAAKKDKAMEQKAYRIVSSVLLDGTEPEPVTVVVNHRKLVFEGLSNRLAFSVLKRIFEDGINVHLRDNELVMAILDYEFKSVNIQSYSANADKLTYLKRKKDRDNRYEAFFNYDD